MTINQFRVGTAVALALALLVPACGGSKADKADPSEQTTPDQQVDVTIATDAPPRSGGTLIYGLDAESDGFDPTESRFASAGTQVGLAIYDPLAAYDVDAVARPYLAESFEPNDSFTEWLITLRPDITFHDGSPLSADVLKTIFEAHKASPLTGPAVAALESVEITGELTALFHMSSPWASFPASLTGQLGLVPSPETIADPAGGRHPSGTGPFEFVSWNPDKDLEVVRNDDYWRTDDDGVALPYLDGVTFQVITEPGNMVSAVEAGDVDMAYTQAPASLARIDEAAAAGKIQKVESSGQSGSAFIMLNTATPPFDDVLARRAVATATDREEYAEVVDLGLTEATSTVFREGTTFYTDSPYPDYDLEAARDLVEQYEAETGEPLAFSIKAGTDAAAQLQLDFLKEAWEAAGMEVTLDQGEQSVMILDVVTGKYQAVSWGGFASPDPDYDYIWWISDNIRPIGELSLNIARNSNPVIDEALNAARATDDVEVRKEAYATFSDQLNEDLPYIWLVRGRPVLYATNDVRGMTQGPLPGGEESYPLGGPGGFETVTRLTQTWLDR